MSAPAVNRHDDSPVASTSAAGTAGRTSARNGIRSLLDPAHEAEHWTECDRVGHFPASEVPDLYVADVRKYFSAHQQAEFH
ncbi:hypothetical protein SK854_41175 [Lentzea sp. BCCO 10_0061]|uniref:Uncharacterized protein n=1 Tax=Lentzea sokolovensis TaxID=3095429 RepID=A0ABU4V9V9_9PSEU|nr:hypothetical protein [Lentzea sp. BCCO 10_0061]MDX8148586.1 hypothetical protein [Lentzea sp. BCCO 10_0061]